MAAVELEADGLPAHFLMGPSSASRWLKCPGSLRVPHPPDDAGEAAQIGTLGHAMVEAALKVQPLDDDSQAFLESLSDYLRADLEDSVTLCVDFVKGLPQSYKRFETKIPSDVLEEHGGTVDVIAVDAETIHVVDFKFGRVAVEIEDNDQVQCYLNLARQLYPGRSKFIGTILQPFRSAEPETHTFTRAELDDHARRVLAASISDEFHAGDHCKYCPLISKCETAARHVHRELKEFPDLTQIVGGIEELPDADEVALVARIYRTYKLAISGAEGAADILKRWYRRGVDLSAVGLAIRVTHTSKWDDGADDVLKDAGLDVSKLKDLVSPAKVRERVGMSKTEFESHFRHAMKIQDIEALVMGKGGQKEFPEFD